jgi:MYXO-CTERM domain-containing protein
MALAATASAATISTSLEASMQIGDETYWPQSKVTPVRGQIVNYSGSWASADGDGDSTPDYEIDWSVDGDPDPFVSGVVGVANNTNAPQDFLFTFVQPVVPPIFSATIATGSVGVTVSDGNLNGATLTYYMGNSSNPVYEAFIDGSSYQTLLPPFPGSPPFPLVAPPVGSNTITNSFGPQLAGGVLTDLRVDIAFRLSPGDIAGVTFNFVVLPVPEPSTVMLGALGLVALVGVGLRRRGR